ncbi:MAG TPA: zinc ribbon domain-containing protein [Candidatus Limnocylindrales bacterium]|nr:zinc ribbon domain-containing protein [Candidatus Limnocylindrales bacterium]
MGTASGTANGNFPYATEVSGTYTLTTTSGYGTASGSGTWSGVLVSGAPSGSSSSQGSTSPSPGQLASRYYGNVASVKGQAWSVNSNGNTPLTSSQIEGGSEIQTGDNGIIGFEPPNQGGEVYLGADSCAGFVGLTSQPAPDNGIQYMIYPPVSSGVIFPDGNQELIDMTISVPLEVAAAVAIFSEPIGLAAAVSLFVEGGAFLIPNGVAYVKETVSHLIVVPQGALAGDDTEYTVNVFTNGTTMVQVLEGPVYFMDPVTNNTLTVDSNQVLTLPPADSSGFTNAELQSDFSALNSASVNQWWTQASATSFSVSSLFSQPMSIVALVLVVAVIVAMITSFIRKRRPMGQARSNESSAFTPNLKQQNNPTNPTIKAPVDPVPQTTQQPTLLFCPSCGNKLIAEKSFCPSSCGFNVKKLDG